MLHITLKDLETFYAIASQGSVTLAAQSLGLTQSAASQALQKLETTLEVQLFDRVNKRLHLNENGRQLLSKAVVLLDHAQQIETLFTQNSVHLRLGASTTIANYILPAQLAKIKSDQPHAHIQMMVGNTQEIVHAVADLSVDFGLIEGRCDHPDLIFEPWMDDELVLFASCNHPMTQHPVSKKALAQAPWILRESGSGTREETDRLLRAWLPELHIAMELGNSEAIKNAVIEGFGISCLSRYVIKRELDLHLLKPLQFKLPPLKRTLFIIRHRDKSITKGMSAFFQTRPLNAS